MFIEFQTATRNIIETLELTLTEMLGGHIAMGPFTAGADSIYLHTVRLAAPAVLQVNQEPVTIVVAGGSATFQGQALFIEQPLTVTFGRVSGATLSLEAPLACSLRLRFRVLNGGATMDIRFDHAQMIAPPAVPAPLVEAYGALATFIEGWAQSSTDVPLAPLALASSPPAVVNLGIAASADRSFVAIRVEFGAPPSNAASWQSFHAGQTPNRLGLQASSGAHGGPLGAWAHFVERTVVEDAIRAFLNESFSKNADYKLESGISSTWSAPNGEARVATGFTFRIPDACKCLAWDVDLVGDFHLDVALTVETENRLTIRGEYGYEITSDAAKDCCVATTVVAWPFLGDDDLGKLKMNRLEWFVGLLQGPIVLGIGINARFGNRQLSADQLGSDCTTNEPWKFTCQRDFSLGGAAAQLMTLEGLVGQADGLVLLGRQRGLGGADGLPSVRPPIFKGVPGTFDWRLQHATCNSIGPGGLAARITSPFAFFFGQASIAISDAAADTGILPVVPDLLVHAAHVIGDPQKEFGVGKLTGGPENYNLDVLCAVPSTLYRATPYPCTVLFQTSAGLATVSIPAPPELNKTEEEARKEAEADFWQAVNQCYAISDPLGKIKVKTVWLPDPAPPWIRPSERHKWTFVVEGREPGFEVQMLDAAQTVAARAVAATRGVIELGFLNLEREMTLQMTRGRTAAESQHEHAEHGHADREQQLAALSRPKSSRMKVVQTSLTRSATIELSTGVVELLSATLDRSAGLLVVERDRMAIYDVTTVGAPVLLDQATIPGIDGVMRAEDGTFLAWGAAGVQRISTSRGRIAPLQQVASNRTLGLLRIDRGWALLSEDGLEFRRGDLEICDRVELPASCGVRLLSARQQPAVLYADGRVAVLRSGAAAWQDLGSIDAVLDWTRSVRVECAGRPMLYAPGRDGGGSIVDFDSAARPYVAAWYRDTPWFAPSVKIGDLTAAVGDGVTLYQTRTERVL